MIRSSIVFGAPPKKGQTALAFSAIVLILLAGLIAIPFGSVRLPVNLGFMPAFGSFVCFADLSTAAFLLGQARAVQSPSAARLSAAYFFSFLIVIPHLLAFPGVFAEGMVIGGEGSATWLWCAWHAGFAIFIAFFTLAPGGDKTAFTGGLRIYGVVIVSTLAIVILTTIGINTLPVILDGNSYARMNRIGVGPAVLAFNLAALFLVVIKLRARSTIALWLIVAMSAACMDVALGLLGNGRFTFGWYLGRALSVLSNTTVFIAMLFESIQVFGRVSRLNLQLEHLALTDPLTQLPNRRAFERSFQAEWRRATREALPISVLMVDIDHFKQYNDHFGHPAGDRCLQLVAETFQRALRRPLDMSARLSGEEFALLLPNTDAEGAAQMANTVRRSVEKLQILNPGTLAGILTVSVGIATDHPCASDRSFEMFIEQADEGLYRAKTSGRNRICPAALKQMETVHTMEFGA